MTRRKLEDALWMALGHKYKLRETLVPLLADAAEEYRSVEQATTADRCAKHKTLIRQAEAAEAIGELVVAFNVHKDGRITDLVLKTPSGTSALGNAIYKAVAASNPTTPLPPTFPDEYAAMTLTAPRDASPPK